MKAVSWFFVVGMLIFIPVLAMAGINGDVLLQKCEPIEKLYDDPAALSSKEASGVVYCLGYIDSFMETFSFQVQAKIVPSLPYCLVDKEIPKKEIVKVVVDYLKNNPEDLAKPAGYFIFMALREVYPCNKENNKTEDESKEAEVLGNKVTADQ